MNSQDARPLSAVRALGGTWLLRPASAPIADYERLLASDEPQRA
jgi:hypothetical protein